MGFSFLDELKLVILSSLSKVTKQFTDIGLFSAARDAPYAKARTTFVRDVQLARTVLTDHFKPVYREPTSSQTSQLL